MDGHTKAVLLSVAAAVAWGVTPAMEKSAVGRVDPVLGIGIRAVCVAAVMVVIVAASPGGLGAALAVDRRTLAYLCASGVVAGIVGMLIYFHALALGSSSVVVPICGSYPLVAALIGVVALGEPLTASRVGATVLIVAGIWLLGAGEH